jgi:hypothetical protein
MFLETLDSRIASSGSRTNILALVAALLSQKKGVQP